MEHIHNFVDHICDVEPFTCPLKEFSFVNQTVISWRSFTEPKDDIHHLLWTGTLLNLFSFSKVDRLDVSRQIDDYFSLLCAGVVQSLDERPSFRRFLLAVYLHYIIVYDLRDEDCLNRMWPVLCCYYSEEEEKTDSYAVDLIDEMLYNLVTLSSKSDKVLHWLFAQIGQFIAGRNARVLYNFFGLTVRLANWNFSALMSEISNDFFCTLLVNSERDEVIFRLVAFLLRINDGAALKDCGILDKFAALSKKLYFVDAYRKNICDLFLVVLDGIVDQDRDAKLEYFLSGAVNIMRESLLRGTDKGIELFTYLCSVPSKWDTDLLRTMAKDSNFDLFAIVAEIVVRFPNKFYPIIEIITELCGSNYRIGPWLNENGAAFFENLSMAEPEEGMDVRLYTFVCCSGARDSSTPLIENRRGILLCFELANGDRLLEIGVVKWLLELARSSTNAYEMFHAGVLPVIYEALPRIQEDNEMRYLYIRLYQSIASVIFSNESLFGTVRLLANKEFNYPNDFLQFFCDELRKPEEKGIRTFFRFTGTATSHLHIPRMEYSKLLTLSLPLRLRRLNPDNFCVLVRCYNAKEKYTVGFYGMKLFLEIETSRETKKNQGNLKFMAGIWYNLNISIQRDSTRTIFITVETGSKKVDEWHLDCKGSIIVEKSLEFEFVQSNVKGLTLLCDVGHIQCSSTETKWIKNRFGPPELQVVWSADPLKSNDGVIYHLRQDGMSVNFEGNVVLSLQSTKEILVSESAVKSFLPLLARPTPRAGTGLPPEIGRQFLLLLLQLFGLISARKVELFEDRKLLAVFGSLLQRIPSELLSELQLFNLLEAIWKPLKLKRFGRDFTKCFWFDFTMLMNWPVSAKRDFLGHVYMELNNSARLDPECNPFDVPFGPELYCALELEKEENMATGMLDDIICTGIIQNQYQQDTEFILERAVLSENELTRSRCRGILTRLVDNNPELFQKFDFVNPFLVFVAGASIIDGLKYLDKLILVVQSNSEIYSLAYKLAFLLRPENVKDNEKGMIASIIDTWFINWQGQFVFSGRFFPLIAQFYSQIAPELAKKFCDEKFITAVNNVSTPIDVENLKYWMHWQLILLISANGVKKVEDFSQCFSVCIHVCIANGAPGEWVQQTRRLFAYFDLFRATHGLDMTAIKYQILVFLFGLKMDAANTRELAQIAFNCIIFNLNYGKANKRIPLPDGVERAFDTMNVKIVLSLASQSRQDRDTTSLASILVDCLVKLDDYIEIVGDFSEHSIVVAAFVICHVLSSDIGLFKLKTRKLLEYLDKKDPMIKGKCANILSDVIIEKVIKFESAGAIIAMIGNSKTRERFRSNLTFDHLSEYLSILQKKFDEFQADFCNHFVEVLQLDKTDLGPLLAEYSSDLLMRNAEKMAQGRRVSYANSERAKDKMLSVFMSELRIGRGAWSKEITQHKFCAFNRQSRTGRRILMKANHEFDRHDKNVSVKAKFIVDNSRFGEKMVQMGVRDVFQVSFTSLKSEGQEGTLTLDNECLSFSSDQRWIQVPFQWFRFILNRRISNVDRGIEIYVKTGETYLFFFRSEARRAEFYRRLLAKKIPPTEDCLPGKFNFFAELQRVCKGICQNNISSMKLVSKLHLTERWKQNQIPTYDYLFYLNAIGGRSFNYLSHYPIYPWLIRQGDNDQIDLNDPSIYRDLSVPVPALSPERLRTARNCLVALADSNEEEVLWREMISSAAGTYVLLVRLEPFTSHHYEFQSDNFDNPNRIFHSLITVMKDMHGPPGCPRECLPEYYTLPQALLNENGFSFGRRSEGSEIGDVILPNWAGSPYQYISAARRALDSEPVGQQIGKWIDLVFGVYRRSMEKNNVFLSFGYPELGVYDNEQIELIGCFPDQLFSEEHPTRNVAPVPAPLPEQSFQIATPVLAMKKGYMFCQDGVYSFINGQPVLGKTKFHYVDGDVWDVSRCLKLVVMGIRGNSSLTVQNMETGERQSIDQGNSLIMCACVAGGEFLVTGGIDGSIDVYKLPDLRHMAKSSNQVGSIVAIAANADLGLVVSVDTTYIMVVQTMLDGKVINHTPLGEHVPPQLAVFKSGIIVVCQPNKVTFYDSRGMAIASKPASLPQSIVSVCKYSDTNQQEYVIVMELYKFIVYDLTSGDVICEFQTAAGCTNRAMCILKGCYAFVGCTEKTCKVFSFRSATSTIIRPSDSYEPPLLQHLHHTLSLSKW